MLLRVVEDGVETPFEIDTGMDNERRWVQIYRGTKCIRQLKSVDQAIDEIEEMLALKELR
jgi:hypothetical protein